MGIRFAAREIGDLIYERWYSTRRKISTLHPQFMDNMSTTFIVLVCTALHDALRGYEKGTHNPTMDFSRPNVGRE